MNLVTALALVIGILGGVATWLLLGFEPVAVYKLHIWAAFIGWASFYHCGGGFSGLQNAIIAGIWGAIMAAVAFILMPIVGMETVGAAICVGVTVAIMILGAHIPLLSAIPAAVYGYASTAAFALLISGADASTAVTSPDITVNPALNIAASLAIGAIFGFVSELIAKAISR